MSIEFIAGRTTDNTYNTVENTDPLVWSNLTGSWTRIASGMPINMFSEHPQGVGSCRPGSVWEDCNGAYYGQASFYDENGNPAPRGSAGTNDWTTEVDLSIAYNVDVVGGDLQLKATIYNVLNSDTQTSVNQIRSQYGDNGLERNPNWAMTTGRLGASYMSFEASYRF